MKDSKSSLYRMTWIIQVILLFIVFSLSLMVYKSIQKEYVKQQAKQKIITK